MSGLESLAAACAIIQTVSFTHEVVSLCYSFYDNKPVALDSLSKYADEMDGAISSIKNHVEKLKRSQPEEEKALIGVLQRAEETTAQLRTKVAYVLEKRKLGNFLKAMRTQFRHARKKSTIETLKSNLEDCVSVAILMLSERDAQKLDAISFQMSEEFGGLSDQVKKVVQDLVQRQIQAEQVARENQERLLAGLGDLSEHVTQSHLDTQSYVKQEIFDRSHEESKKRAYEKLLDSLRFPEIWQRQQMIDLDEATFEDKFDFRDILMEQEDRQKKKSIRAERYRNKSEEHLVTDAINSLRAWIETGGTLFWISGYAGSGKSTLVKFLVDKESRHSKKNPSLKKEVLVHYFWKAGSAVQKNKFGCLCSLISQMLQHDEHRCQLLLDMNVGFAQKRTFHDWSKSELDQAFRHLVKSSSNTFVVFIDGLDEIGVNNELFSVLEMLEIQTQMPNTHFCISSRPEYILQQRLGENPTIAVQDLTHESIRQYVRRKLGPSLAQKKTKLTYDETESLYRDVTSKADGIFLWVCLVTEILIRCILQDETYNKVVERLNKMPSKLESLFTDMWKRMGDDFASNQKLAASFISMVLLRQQLSHVADEDRVFPQIYLLSFAHIVWLSVDIEGAEQFFGLDHEADVSSCLTWLEDKKHEMDTHCMGLLVCTPFHASTMSRTVSPEGPKQKQDARLKELLQQSVGFVHRSALDYFTNTTDGQQIAAKSEITYTAGCSAFARALGLRLLLITEPAMNVQFYVEFTNTAQPHVYAGWAITALSQAYRYRDRGRFADLHRTIDIFAQSFQRLKYVQSFHALAAMHVGMIDLLLDQCSSSPGLATTILRDYWINPECLDPDAGPNIISPMVLVQRLMDAGADPLEPISPAEGQSTSHRNAFSEFVCETWETLATFSEPKTNSEPNRRKRLLEYWAQPDSVLAVLDTFLSLNPKLDHVYSYDVRRESYMRYHAPVVVFYKSTLKKPRSPWGSSESLTFGLDDLWLCDQLIMAFAGLDLPTLRVAQSPLTRIQDKLAELQQSQGLQGPALRILYVVFKLRCPDVFFWRTGFDETSARLAMSRVLELYSKTSGGFPDEDYGNALRRLTEILLVKDNPHALLLLDEDTGRRPMDMPYAEPDEWLQRSHQVHCITRQVAERYAQGQESPEMPFLISRNKNGDLQLRAKGTIDTGGSGRGEVRHISIMLQ